MKRSVLVEWESDDSVPPIGSEAFFKVFETLADLMSDFPSDVVVTHDGVSARRVGGKWTDLPDAAPVNQAEVNRRDLARAQLLATQLTLINLLTVGLELGLLTSGEVKVLSRGDLIPLLFARAETAGLSARLVRAVSVVAERPRAL
jgi:hypothetical protein